MDKLLLLRYTVLQKLGQRDIWINTMSNMNTWYNIKLDKLSINLEESVSGPMGLSGSCIWSWVWPNGRHIARAKRTSSSTGEWILSGPALQQLHPKTQSQTNVFDYNRDYCYGSKQLCCNTNQLIHNVVVCRRWERPARTPVCRTLQSMKPHPPMIPRAPGWSCSVSDSEVHSANHLRERSTVHYKRPSLLTEFKINCKENTIIATMTAILIYLTGQICCDWMCGTTAMA